MILLNQMQFLQRHENICAIRAKWKWNEIILERNAFMLLQHSFCRKNQFIIVKFLRRNILFHSLKKILVLESHITWKVGSKNNNLYLSNLCVLFYDQSNPILYSQTLECVQSIDKMKIETKFLKEKNRFKHFLAFWIKCQSHLLFTLKLWLS